jgi:hypothetical protein
MKRMVWKVWASPKVKFSAWLALQNRLWMTDWLQRHGWQNCGICSLCKRTAESIDHLLVYKFIASTQKIWGLTNE